MGSDLTLGIDLGTTNTAAAVVEGTRPRVVTFPGDTQTLPSVVSFDAKGNILVGHQAQVRRTVDARNTVYSTKRLLGRPFESKEVQQARKQFPFEVIRERNGGTGVRVRGGERHSLPEISALILRKLRTVVGEQEQAQVRQCVITVPANFNDLQRAATDAAGRIAELHVLRLLNEPTAAAIAHGVQRSGQRKIAVYDLGGGTFDVSILQLENQLFRVLSTTGHEFLGGNDIDRGIADRFASRCKKKHNFDPRTSPESLAKLLFAAEDLKRRLSQEDAASTMVEDLQLGDTGRSVAIEYRMTRQELSDLTRPFIHVSLQACDEALALAKIRAKDLDGVLLIGGQTQMPIVRHMVSEHFGVPLLVDSAPDTAVARGAAIHAASLLAHKERVSALKKPPTPAHDASSKNNTLRPLTSESSKKTESVSQSNSLTASLGPRQTNPDQMPFHSPRRDTTGSRRRAGTVDFRSSAGVPVASAAEGEAASRVRGRSGEQQLGGGLPVVEDIRTVTLSVEVVGGRCEPVVRRGASLPALESREFSTSRDFQTHVEVRIYAGEARLSQDNAFLGTIVLKELEPRPRGQSKINVSFAIDTSGMLKARATDGLSGKRQAVEINLAGALERGSVDAKRQAQRHRFGA